MNSSIVVTCGRRFPVKILFVYVKRCESNGSPSRSVYTPVNLRALTLFIGCPDDREALAIAWRMSMHQGIQLSMVRMLISGDTAEVDIVNQIKS
ncbi:hypothetical protein RJT34_03897 [Clitoria ternatea]|uniref:Uncharacterized protein n=1 Tax=Clitoria ternatea TaxID=43366 RepID=A0AAN9KNT3_CLITE